MQPIYGFGGQVYGREVREVNDVNVIKEGSTSNCSMQVKEHKGKPHLVIVATEQIEPGDELVYDYADNMEARISHLNSFTATSILNGMVASATGAAYHETNHLLISMQRRKLDYNYWLDCGLDPDGFTMNYISDYQGKYNYNV
jgi:SET domain-containing protein